MNITQSLLDESTKAALERHVARRIPEHCRQGLLDYLRYGLSPGHFLTAVLSNNLAEACGRADVSNQRALYDYMFILYNYAPSDAWGSPTNVQGWLQRGREMREP